MDNKLLCQEKSPLMATKNSSTYYVYREWQPARSWCETVAKVTVGDHKKSHEGSTYYQTSHTIWRSVRLAKKLARACQKWHNIGKMSFRMKNNTYSSFLLITSIGWWVSLSIRNLTSGEANVRALKQWEIACCGWKWQLQSHNKCSYQLQAIHIQINRKVVCKKVVLDCPKVEKVP